MHIYITTTATDKAVSKVRFVVSVERLRAGLLATYGINDDDREAAS